MKRVTSILSVFALMAGCASNAPLAPRTADVIHKYEKSYELGKRSRAAVGDPVVKVKDYYLERVETLAVRPTVDITMSRAMSPTISYKANQSYPITHQIEVNGAMHFFVPSPQAPTLGAVVHPNGTIYPRKAALLGSSPALAWADSTISPADARMVQDVDERVLKTKGYVNYEIIYNGRSGSSINLTYREFTREDVARSAFFQNLTYEASVDNIGFRQLRIQVHSATNEAIEFTVLQDAR